AWPIRERGLYFAAQSSDVVFSNDSLVSVSLKLYLCRVSAHASVCLYFFSALLKASRKLSESLENTKPPQLRTCSPSTTGSLKSLTICSLSWLFSARWAAVCPVAA